MPTKLFVGGIPYRTTEEELKDFFSQAGEVTSVYIPMVRETHRPRGFAFVEMVDDAAAEKAISMFNGAEMGGRRIAVNKARPMEERGNSGFRNSRSGNDNAYGAGRDQDRMAA